MADFGVTVIGGGAVGLAVAARLARRGDVLLLERNAKHGMETSSRNSEVIHAGIYYPEGSWKARMCVRGKHLLYERCEARCIAHKRITKIITAAKEDERAGLEKLFARGSANGADLQMISGEKARELEPHVRSVAAILSPTTGVVSAHEYMDDLARSAESDGALIKTRSEVVGIERRSGEYVLHLRSGEEQETVTTERV